MTNDEIKEILKKSMVRMHEAGYRLRQGSFGVLAIGSTEWMEYGVDKQVCALGAYLLDHQPPRIKDIPATIQNQFGVDTSWVVDFVSGFDSIKRPAPFRQSQAYLLGCEMIDFAISLQNRGYQL